MITKRNLLRLWLVALTFTAAAAFSQNTGSGERHWVATWGTAQTSYLAPQAARATAPPRRATPPENRAASPAPGVPARRFPVPVPMGEVEDQTIRMVLRSSIGGSQVRIRLTNAYGAENITIGAAYLGLRGEGSAIQDGSGRAVTFSGRASATLYGGGELASDPVTLEVPPLTDLAVSVYLPEATGRTTTHRFSLRPVYVADGNHAADAFLPDARMEEGYYWLAGVDVLAPEAAGALVTFGDSITDGDQSTPDTLGMWPAVLAARLQSDAATRQVAVVNAGIAGNRVLGGNGSGLVRFRRDALSHPGVKWVSILEGINDITGATRGAGEPTLTADDLIAAYRQMIAMAHAQGVRVIGCTLTPYGGSNVYRDAGEAIRSEVNQWIRSSGEFDAVIDFEDAVRDADDPLRFRAEADSPDLLHPSNPGYKLMADSIDLSIFR